MGVEGQGSGHAREGLILACVARGALRGQLHQLQPHLVHTRVDQANLPGYPIGYINFASFLVRTPVINAHNFKLAVSRVHDTHPSAKWQVRMSRSQRLGVKGLPVRGALAIKVGTIPAGIADPHLDGLDWLTAVGHKRCFDTGCNQEHQRHPTDCSPSHEEWSSHSVFIPLQIIKKCSRNTALCQPISRRNLSLNSLKENVLAITSCFANPPAMTSLALGSAKLAVPTCTADAPTAIYSSTSSAVSIPPSPTMGISTAFRTSQTSRSVIGLIAGPDSPPVCFPSRDRLVLTSMAIAG